MNALRRIFAVAALLVFAFMLSQAIPAAAQTRTTGSSAPTFTAPPIRSADVSQASASQYVPVNEQYNLPQVLLTPLHSPYEYFPVFGRQAGGLAQEVVQPEARIQERTEDRIQPQPKIGAR